MLGHKIKKDKSACRLWKMRSGHQNNAEKLTDKNTED